VGGLAQLGGVRTARHSPVASAAWARFIVGTVRRGLPAAQSHSVTGRRRQGACRTAWRAGRLLGSMSQAAPTQHQKHGGSAAGG